MLGDSEIWLCAMKNYEDVVSFIFGNRGNLLVDVIWDKNEITSNKNSKVVLQHNHTVRISRY